MQDTFSNIKQFIESKDSCVFCGRKLKCVLTSFDLGPHRLPIINSTIVNDVFDFSFTYTTAIWNIDFQSILNINNNLLTLTLLSGNASSTNETYILSKHALEKANPHIEMYCSSKKCKMKYILYSNMLKCDKVDDKIEKKLNLFKIQPIHIYMESFEVDKLWVQNDWIHNSLNIYSKSHMDSSPIKYSSILDLHDMDKDKVINRIRTLITFS